MPAKTAKSVCISMLKQYANLKAYSLITELNHTAKTITMKEQFDELRTKIEQNLKLYFRMFCVSGAIAVLLIPVAIVNDHIYKILSGATAGFTAIFSTANYVGYLNAKLKVNIHNIRVQQYLNGAPPPQDETLEKIIENAKISIIKS